MFFCVIKPVVGAVRIEYCFFPALHCLNMLRASKEGKVFSKFTGVFLVWACALWKDETHCLDISSVDLLTKNLHFLRDILPMSRELLQKEHKRNA